MNEDLLRDLEAMLDALASLFATHRRLLESSLGTTQITSAQERIRKKQEDIQKDRDRIASLRAANTRRTDLERRRQQKASEKPRSADTNKGTHE